MMPPENDLVVFVALIFMSSVPGFILGMALGIRAGRLVERIGLGMARGIERMFAPKPASTTEGKADAR